MVRVRGEPQPQADTLACTVRIRTRTDLLEAHLRPSSGGGGGGFAVCREDESQGLTRVQDLGHRIDNCSTLAEVNGCMSGRA